MNFLNFRSFDIRHTSLVRDMDFHDPSFFWYYRVDPRPLLHIKLSYTFSFVTILADPFVLHVYLSCALSFHKTTIPILSLYSDICDISLLSTPPAGSFLTAPIDNSCDKPSAPYYGTILSISSYCHRKLSLLHWLATFHITTVIFLQSAPYILSTESYNQFLVQYCPICIINPSHPRL